MFGLDMDLFDLSAPDLIEKFRKDIEKEVKEPVNTFSFYHVAGTNEISINAVVQSGTKKKIIRGRMISFMIRKGLKMKLGKDVTFQKVELVYSPEQIFIIYHTDKGIETQKL